MPALAEFQDAMASWLRARPGEAPSKALLDQVAAGNPLAVYRNNVAVRFVEALAETYPTVGRLVGEEFFRFAALEYAYAHPPSSHTLLHYGHLFPKFLAAFEPAEAVPYLSDVARLEWLYVESYHAAEAACVLSLEDVRTDEPLMLHPSARLMHSGFPASHIWEINCRAEPVEQGVELPAGPDYLLIIRPEAQVEVRRLKAETYLLLSAAKRGLTLGQMTDLAAPGDIADLISGGTFIKADLKETTA